MKLYKSNVIFNPLEHTYTLNDKLLSGITPVLSKFISPNKYNGVPIELLERAKDYGSFVHSQVQLFCNGFPPSQLSEELLAFKNLNLNVVASEYLIDDGERFASSIDLVIKESNKAVSLADIKTSVVLDIEYLAWQLSIYATLFELNNPKIKVNKLYGVHLRGCECKLVEVKRIDNQHVLDILKAFAEGNEHFDNPLKRIDNDEDKLLLAQAFEVERCIVDINNRIKLYNDLQKHFKERIKQLMDERGITKWETEHLSITRKADSTRKSVDNELLKQKHPDIYNECLKEINVNGTVLIKIL